MKIFLNGKFDLLHPGHFNLFVYARALAGRHGRVIVAIDTDRRIIEQTGIKPLFTQEERVHALTQLTYPYGDTTLKLVDGVYYFDSDEELLQLINSMRPFHLIKGDDWKQKQVIGSDVVDILFFRSEYEMHSKDIINRIVFNYPT